MTSDDQLQSQLRSSITPELYPHLPQLIKLLKEGADGRLSPAGLQQQINDDPVLASVLSMLDGQHVVLGHMALSVTASAERPTVSVGRVIFTGGGDYAEGNIDKRQGAFIGAGAIVN